MKFNPRQKCGACCAIYKVLFPSAETDDHAAGVVPLEYTVIIGPEFSAMRGTERFFKRCIALEGVIGQQVRCQIYEKRPSACYLFIPSWEGKTHNARCDRARSCCGLTA
jgi:Fe-S-cluster containining protein